MSHIALFILGIAVHVADAGSPDGGTTPSIEVHFASGMQAAIDSTPNGGTVVLRPGVYGEIIRIKNRRGLKIIARGGPAVVLHQATDWTGWQSGSHANPLLVIEDSSDILLENIYIRRDVQRERDAFGATTAQIIASKRITLKHVYVGTGDGKALEIGNSDVTVLDSTLEALQYGIAQANSTVTVTESSIVAEQVPVAVFTQGCPGNGFTISRSYLRGRYGLAICLGEFARLRGNVIAGSLRKFSDVPKEVLDAEAQNTLIPEGAAVPELKDVKWWRPEASLLTKHLEDFAVLPPLSADGPAKNSDWFVCTRNDTTDWRLFPDGPTTAMTMPIPLMLPSCSTLFEPPAEGAPVRFLEQRGEWLKLRPDKAYIETGPHRVEQGFWIRASTIATPCLLTSSDARVWTPFWSGDDRSIEIIDDRRVSVRGTVDYCRTMKETKTIELPSAMRPATKRQFKLECTMQPNPQHCGQ